MDCWLENLRLMHISRRVVCDKNNHFTTFLLSVEWPVDRMKKEVRLMNRKYGTVILHAILSIMFFILAVKKTSSFGQDSIGIILLYLVAVLNAILAIIHLKNELKRKKS